MCIIIHREQGSNVPNSVLEHNRKKNPDGFGLAWRDDEGLHHKKYAPTAYDEFHDMLKRLDRNPSIEYVAHYRFATHGPACERLSHPFPYEDEDGNEVLVFHNGIINIQTESHESDTSRFVERVLANLPTGWWNNSAIRFLVEQSVSGSRLLVMSAKNTVRLNERLWTQQNGIFYSTEPGPYKPATNYAATYPRPGQVVKYTPKATWEKEDNRKQGKKNKHGRSRHVPAPSFEKSTDDRNFGFKDADDEPQGWMHNGHWVESLDSQRLAEDPSEDVACSAICTECQTMGEVYIIGGTTFIDVSHGDEVRDEDEDLDALTMASVYAN